MSDTHVQLLVVDDLSQGDLFSKSKLGGTKRLLEGHGMVISNKQKHPFTGFVGCFTLLTMNNLPYPYTADKPDDLLEEKEYK